MKDFFARSENSTESYTRISKSLLTLGLAFHLSFANGEIIDLGDHTLDTETNLEWLDLTFTRPSNTAADCFDFVANNLGPGGKFEGYRIPTKSQVNSLWINFVKRYTDDKTIWYSSPNRTTHEAHYYGARDMLDLLADGGYVFFTNLNGSWARADAFTIDVGYDKWNDAEGRNAWNIGYTLDARWAFKNPGFLTTELFPNYCNSRAVYLVRDHEVDSDSDGVFDDSDNCPSIPNPDQADLDGDSIGDACDTDVDGDSVENTLDNCPLVANSDQLDVDGDLIGDACDDLIDNDADGIANDLDNCPAVPNADQADNDGDHVGDACDLDDDNDGVEDTVDNCSLTANEDQADNDSDNIGDVCDSDDDNDAIEDDLDNCPLIANVSQDDNDGDGFGDVCDPDDDNDAVEDLVDNCPLSFNPDQSNTDGVGAGNACNDAFDVDDDDWENDYDNCPDVANRNQSDYDYDNIGDACDSDVDGDEVANAADACELTPIGELVGSIGCSIEQLCPCEAPRQSTDPWKNHGQYVSCMTKAAQSFAADGVISGNEKSDLVNAPAQSSCGY